MKADLLTPVWAERGRRPQFTNAQWEVVLGQARQARLLGRLAQHFIDNGWLDTVPAGPRRHLESGLKIVDRLAHEVRWELDCIAQALVHTPGPMVLLKGAAYFAAGLPPSRGRLFGDIDILVQRAGLPQVEEALFTAGWISAERDPYNQRYYRKWMHEIPPLQHVQRGSAIDVHHTITPPTSSMSVDGAALLPAARPAAPGSAFQVLAPTDMVLHSAVHLFQEGEFAHGLRDLLDLDDLLSHFAASESGFWPALFERAKQLRLTVPLHHALFHIERLFGSRVPAEQAAALRRIRPAWPARAAMAVLLGQALRPHHPSCDGPLPRLSQSLLYVRAHALRMPLHLALPHLVRKAWMRRFPDRSQPAMQP